MTEQALNFQCPACRATLSVPASMAGVKGPCPHCRTEIMAPVPGVRKETLVKAPTSTGPLSNGNGAARSMPTTASSGPAPTNGNGASLGPSGPLPPNGSPSLPAGPQPQSQGQPAAQNGPSLNQAPGGNPPTHQNGPAPVQKPVTGGLQAPLNGPKQGPSFPVPNGNGVNSGIPAPKPAVGPANGQLGGSPLPKPEPGPEASKDPTGWFKDPSNGSKSGGANPSGGNAAAGAESFFGGAQPKSVPTGDTSNPFLNQPSPSESGPGKPDLQTGGATQLPKTGAFPSPAQTPEAGAGQMAPGFSTGQLPPPGSSNGLANGQNRSNFGTGQLPSAPTNDQREPGAEPKKREASGGDSSNIWQGGSSGNGSVSEAGNGPGKSETGELSGHASWGPPQPGATGQASSPAQSQTPSGPGASPGGLGASLFFQEPTSPKSLGPETVSAVPQGNQPVPSTGGVTEELPSQESNKDVTGALSESAEQKQEETQSSKADPFGSLGTGKPKKGKSSAKAKVSRKKKAPKGKGKGGKTIKLVLGTAVVCAIACGGAYYTWPQWKDTKVGEIVGGYIGIEKDPIGGGMPANIPNVPTNPKPTPNGPNGSGTNPGGKPGNPAGKPVTGDPTVAVNPGGGNPPENPPTGGPKGGETNPGGTNTQGEVKPPIATVGGPDSPGTGPENTDPVVNPTPPVSPPTEKPKVLVDVPPIAKDAAAALQGFLRAETWESRLAFCQLPEKIKGMMEGYYSAMPDGPVDVRTIRFQERHPAPDSDYHFYVFNISTGDMPQEFPVSVEETAEGLKVDWRTFVEFKDALLMKYVAAPREETGMFFVRLERAHYFEDDVPELEQKHCFRLSAPMPGHQAYAFLEKSSDLAASLDEHIRWNDIMYALAHIRWTKSAEGNPYIELVGVPQYNWRSDGRGS